MNNDSAKETIKFSCEYCMRYHHARSHHLSFVDKVIQFAAVMPMVIHVFSIDSWLGLVLPLDLSIIVIGFLVILGLIFDPSGQSHRHDLLYKEFARVHKKVEGIVPLDEITITKASKKLIILYSLELYPYRALEMHCENQVRLTRSDDDRFFVTMKWYHKMLRNYFRFQGTEFANNDKISVRSSGHVNGQAPNEPL